MALPFSPANELAVMRYLRDFCQQYIQQFNQFDSGEGSSSNAIQTCARLRQQERAALSMTLRLVQQELASLEDDVSEVNQ
jgi:hypothetical protein